MRKEDIDQIVEARLEDAKALLAASRFDGAVYMCGYAVELGLKSRICTTLNWSEYPSGGNYRTFKTHDLDILLHLSGVEDTIKLGLLAEWSIVATWSPESRYQSVGDATQSDAEDMISSTESILESL